MTSSSHYIDRDIEDFLIATVRDAAAKAIMPRFRNLSGAEVSQKTGETDLVTLADTEAERMMTEAIRRELPEAIVVGEEAVSADPSLLGRIEGAPFCVILDPVDGTWNFAHGLGLFGVILAVCRYGEPVYGLLYDPVTDDMIGGNMGRGAFRGIERLKREKLRASAKTELGTLSGYIPLNVFPREVQPDLVAAVPEFLRILNLRCAVHEYRMVAQGHMDFCLSGTLNSWDHAAGSLVVREAGGVSKMLTGEPYSAAVNSGYLLTAGTSAAWNALAERFAFLVR